MWAALPYTEITGTNKNYFNTQNTYIPMTNGVVEEIYRKKRQ